MLGIVRHVILSIVFRVHKMTVSALFLFNSFASYNIELDSVISSF